MDEAFKPTLSLGQQLFAAGWAYLRFYLDHPGYFRILMLPNIDAQPEQSVPYDAAAGGARRVPGAPGGAGHRAGSQDGRGATRSTRTEPPSSCGARGAA